MPALYRAEMCDRLVEAMAKGLTADAAAARIGISARSLFSVVTAIRRRARQAPARTGR
jgi:hypothetical protein